VWLDDAAEEALEALKVSGLAESDAVRKALVEAAARSKAKPLVSDPRALEQALEKSHELAAKILTTERPPR
jgi:hypothetical protein